MFNIFKIKIPKENQQEVTVLKSYTVKWTIWTHMSVVPDVFHKVLINKSDAKEFIKQLNECATFLRTKVVIEMWEN